METIEDLVRGPSRWTERESSGRSRRLMLRHLADCPGEAHRARLPARGW